MKLIFTSQKQAAALEVLGYILVIGIAFIILLGLGFNKWENYAISLFICALVGVIYTLFVKHNAYLEITKFLCRLSGKDYDPLNEREKILYGVIGMTLFIPGLLAIFTFPYLLQTSFNVSTGMSYLMSLPFVFLIFLVDRSFVATMGYKKKIGAFLIRFLLAGLLGWFLAKPIELQLFHKEIKEELSTQGITKLNNLEKEWQGEQNRLKLEEAEAKKEEIRARSEYEAEINTSIAGRTAGHGPEAKKKLAYWEEQKDIFDKKKIELDNEKSRLEKIFQEKKKNYQDTKSSGLGAQIQALDSVSGKYPSVRFFHWVIMLTILLIDLSPLLAKFLMTKTPSDRKEEQEDMDAEQSKNKVSISHKYELMAIEIKAIVDVVQKLKLSKEEKKNLIEGEKLRITRKYFGEDGLQNIINTPVSAN